MEIVPAFGCVSYCLLFGVFSCKHDSQTTSENRLEDDHQKVAYPSLAANDARMALTGTWVLVEGSLNHIKSSIVTVSDASCAQSVDQFFMTMMMSGTKSPYSAFTDHYVGVVDARFFERGSIPYSDCYTTPGSIGPQVGYCAQLFAWKTSEKAPDTPYSWPNQELVHTWLRQTVETTPDRFETYVYAVIERDGELILRGTSPFADEGTMVFLEWRKLGSFKTIKK